MSNYVTLSELNFGPNRIRSIILGYISKPNVEIKLVTHSFKHCVCWRNDFSAKIELTEAKDRHICMRLFYYTEPRFESNRNFKNMSRRAKKSTKFSCRFRSPKFKNSIGYHTKTQATYKWIDYAPISIEESRLNTEKRYKIATKELEYFGLKKYLKKIVNIDTRAWDSLSYFWYTLQFKS